MTDQRCETCRFNRTNEDTGSIECHRHAPRSSNFQHQAAIDADDIIPLWQLVDSADWCGEWENEHGLSSSDLLRAERLKQAAMAPFIPVTPDMAKVGAELYESMNRPEST